MVATSTRKNPLESFGTLSPSKTDPNVAMQAADGMFGLRKVSLADYSGMPANDDLHVVVRTDTNTAIGQVGERYECMPNEEFFGDAARQLVETGATIERFQMLDNGRRAFMRFAWPEDKNITIGRPKVGDIVGRRATLFTSHDGTSAGKFSLQMLRLACENGMTIPVGEYDWSMIHSVGGHQSLVDLGDMIPTIETYVRKFETAATILSETPVADEVAMRIIKKVADPADKAGKNKTGESNQSSKRIDDIARLFFYDQPGADNDAIKGTGWGLHNACVDYWTHGSKLRGRKNVDSGEHRFKSLLPGGSASTQILNSWKIVTKGLGVTEHLEAAVAEVN